MNITIIDVAKKAGVSPSTVSRVISGSTRISAATSQKVKAVMEELGYHPNLMAKNLVSRTTMTIGLLLPRNADEAFLDIFFSEVTRGILSKATRAGYDLLLKTGKSEQEELDAVNRLVKGRRVDGIILLQSRLDDNVIRFLQKEKFPFVLIGRDPELPDILTVDNDNVQSAYDVTKHLLDRGHSRIGYASGPLELVVSADRHEGYRQALSEAGIEPPPGWFVNAELLRADSTAAVRELMESPGRPTALVVMDDLLAFGILNSLSELGYSVPGDMAVFGFNDNPMSPLSSPPVSSVDIGVYDLGLEAAGLLLRSIKGEPIEQRRVIVPHRLIPRESST
ncbi:LacI family transcriptional regulator [Paenibacillus pasadenensis]|uniref:LacI family DNA-binding transcriptional regulator n=1 Tax=Paenibacillus pasadenensis TaxID=217090 RepID=UPI00203DC07B|nr:LacI family DNA-binding transcriptional regulator [Paenibacillus pasadenensis]MCM3748750.1 LacI family transcriptional regulator [Paenibacillus pasadenensis]